MADSDQSGDDDDAGRPSVRPSYGGESSSSRQSRGGDDDDGRPSSRPSHVPTLKSASIQITRLQLLEYMKQRHWWTFSQANIVFTLCMWATFMAQVWMRGDIVSAFNVHDAIAQHVQQVTAHPSLSGVPLKLKSELPTSCRCACRTEIKSEPVGPCDPDAEVLDFSGILPPTDKEMLMENACTDMPMPLAEFERSLGANMSNYSCQEWVASYGTYADPLAGRRVACSAENFEAYLHDHFTMPEHVNDTDSHFLYHRGDFHGPRWRCPATCGTCTKPVEHGTPPLRLHQLASEDDVWYWVEHGLLPDMFALNKQAPTQQSPGLLQQRNLIVGGVRARQRRAETPYDCMVPESLQSYYIPACRSPERASSFGKRLMYSGQVQFSTLVASQNLTQYMGEGGAIDALSDGAYAEARLGDELGVFDTFFEIERPAVVAMQLAAQLRRERWLDRAARGLDIQALLVNPEANFYSLLEVTFNFRYDGRTDKEVKVRVFPITKPVSLMEYIPELIWVGLIMLLFFQEMFQVGLMCYQRQLKEYFTDFWNLVDWVSILLGLSITVYWFQIVGRTVTLTESLVKLPRSPLPAELDLDGYRSQWVDVLDQGFSIYGVRSWYLFMLFVYASVITARFLKGCLGQQKLSMIQFAFTGSFYFVFHFQVIFGVCFTNFVTGGHVLFGPELEEWSTISRSASTTLQMLLGTFDFDRMYEILPVSATIWLLLFLFSMVFLLMNLLTAILVDHFHTIRKIVGPTDSVFQDIKAGFADFMWRCEWRVEQVRDGEYREFLANPYADLIEGMSEAAKISDQMDLMSQRSSLGLRIARARQDVKSINGLADDGKEDSDPALVNVTSLELRKIGCDPFTAEHLMEECDADVQRKKVNDDQMQHKQVEQLRSFLKLLRSHREKMVNYCDSIESGVQEEQSGLLEDFESLEVSLHDTLRGLAELEETQVDSLALAPPRLEFAGTSLRDTYTNKLNIQPPRKGTAPVPGRGGLRLTADVDSPLALGYGFSDPGRAPPALADGSFPPAIAYGSDVPLSDAIVDGSQLAVPGLVQYPHRDVA